MSEFYTVPYERRIVYADADPGGVVYYANYLRYFEEARAEYIRSVGLTLKDLHEKNCIFVVREAYVDYRSPARLDDLLTIDCWIESRTKVLLLFKYRIRRKDAPEDEVLIEGWTRLAACQLKRDGRVSVARMPKWVTGPLDEVGVPMA